MQYSLSFSTLSGEKSLSLDYLYCVSLYFSWAEYFWMISKKRVIVIEQI